MFYRTAFTAAMALALAAPVFAQEAPATEAPEATADMPEMTADSVVATVNGVDITLGAVLMARQSLPEQYQELPNDVLLPGLIDQLVDQEVLGQAAGDMTLTTELYIENQVRAAKAGEKVNEILQTPVDDDALQAAYDSAYGEFEGSTEYSAAHILVETEDEAKALAEELAGGADFAELAKEKSTGPSGPNGGDLGWFSEGMMVAPFEEAVKTLSDGEVSAPIETQFGWHVIKLNGTRMSEAPALDEVRGELTETVRQEALQAQLETLKSEAEIDRADVSTIDPALITDLSLLEQ